MIEMLKRPEGATVEQIAAATGWQHHTIRGAISGALKKKLGLTVEATRTREVGPNKTGAKGSSDHLPDRRLAGPTTANSYAAAASRPAAISSQCHGCMAKEQWGRACRNGFRPPPGYSSFRPTTPQWSVAGGAAGADRAACRVSDFREGFGCARSSADRR